MDQKVFPILELYLLLKFLVTQILLKVIKLEEYFGQNLIHQEMKLSEMSYKMRSAYSEFIKDYKDTYFKEVFDVLSKNTNWVVLEFY